MHVGVRAALEIDRLATQVQTSVPDHFMEPRMADVEWKSLPVPMWPPGSIMADCRGRILEVSFEEGVPTWKVQRQMKDALPELIARGTADSVTAAKAAALHVAEALTTG